MPSSIRRPSGRGVVIAWLEAGAPEAVVDLEFPLPRAPRAVAEYSLDGSAAPARNLAGAAVRNVLLRVGHARVFEVR